MNTSMKAFADAILRVNGEMKPGKGEDSYYTALADHMAVVSAFDGLGGSGAARYKRYGEHTGAYMASRIAAGALADWFRDLSLPAAQGRTDILQGVEQYIRSGLEVCRSHADQRRGVMGSMVRDFPTTAAMAFALPGDRCVELLVGWAGDSRVYLLEGQGLAQLTADDTEDADALSQIYSGAAMTNTISSDGRWKLNWRRYRIDRPCLIFAATDGCFDYVPTPMEFEALLLESILGARNLRETEIFLNRRIASLAADDYTLALLSLGYGSFEATQRSLTGRYLYLQEQYIPRLEALSDLEDQGEIRAAREALWAGYRQNYYRCLEGGSR